jgi:ATP-dependent Clp protease ATP-binding subunit ClpC
MFGDADRMIRLDMSELQTPESLDRILGSSDGSMTDALVDLVRRRPFSVLLLDEFEKANGRVWDVFLQVFDDARLTDRRGATVDFRHTVIILTSNLGGVIPSGVSVGFGSERQGFDESSVIQAIEKTFRKEFINRLDRVVVFRPLTRDLMRQILQRELDAAFDRRGLRSRAWAVEWDEAAIEFLLDKGFTRDLGSRPLKRAIERHLLSPLAVTMVEHRVPAGEQFLFISRDGDELKVAFVDPDGVDAEAAEADAPTAAAPAVEDGQGLGAIVLHPQGSDAELDLLRARFETLSSALDSGAWRDRKASTMALMGDPDFWQLAERFEILAQAEYMDRIDSAARRLKSLLDRLRGDGRARRQAHPAPLLSTAALNLYLLETACADVEQGRPIEAFVQVEPEPGTARKGAPATEFAAEIGGMYAAWIRKRRMHGRVLAEERSAAGYRLVLAVAGFGAFSILENEDGLHTLERPGEGGRAERISCRVRVVAQDTLSPDRSPQALKTAAARQLAARQPERARIVRRYRRSPSPLVRDAVRGWKTGRLDLVLGGDFDLMAES